MATLTLPETEVKQTEKKSTPTKYVYFFGGGKADGDGKMKDVLGGKGAGLAEMTNAGLPVPPGFTIQTEACREYMRQNAVSREVDEPPRKCPTSSNGRWVAERPIRCSRPSVMASSRSSERARCAPRLVGTTA